MNQAQRQYLIWLGVAVVALVGIGLITFLVGRLTLTNVAARPTSLPPTPTNTPLPPPVITIQGIKAKAELATVEFNSVAEIYNENAAEGWLDEFLGAKERLLMLVYGNVQAGFDLEKLDEADLWTDGARVRLVLPAPEILNSNIDFDRTHIVFYENTLILDQNDPNLTGAALAQAQAAIEQAALENGILTKANEYGQLYFENFLFSLGFTEVEVVVDAQIFKE
ncbi:MAG: DUF4230 domain-containing protein [Anaerolineae bacterium]|nr:DUF4230 domain-containing protein [Anaerolineae bacterium]